IRYVEQGSGEPVVLVHGYTSYIERAWIENNRNSPPFGEGVLNALAKNYHVIAFDLRGHGKSDKPHDPAKYGAQISQDIVRLLDHLRIPRAHIIGYSYGATNTATLLSTTPDRFITATLGG